MVRHVNCVHAYILCQYEAFSNFAARESDALESQDSMLSCTLSWQAISPLCRARRYKVSILEGVRHWSCQHQKQGCSRDLLVLGKAELGSVDPIGDDGSEVHGNQEFSRKFVVAN